MRDTASSFAESPLRKERFGRVVDLAAAGAVAALAVFFAVRFALYAGPLWRDEVDTLNLAKMPVSVLWNTLDRITLPPAYPLLLGLWASVGWRDEDVAMRLFGLATGLAVLAALWIVGARVGGSPPALALALFGTHAVAVHTTASIIVYGVGLLTVIAAVGAFWGLASAPRLATFVGAAGAAVLAAQLQYQNLIHVSMAALAAAAVNVLSGRRKAAALPFAAVALAALSLLPYQGAVTRSLPWRALFRNPIDRTSAIGRLADVISSFSTPVLVVWLGIAALALLGLARWAWGDRRDESGATRERVLYAALTAALGTAAVVTLFWLTGPSVMPRHLLALVALLALGLDVVVTRLSPRWTRVAAIVAVVVVASPLAMDRLSVRLTSVDVTARHLEHAAGPNDLIVIAPWFVGVTFDRYYRGATPWTTLPPLPDLKNHRYDLIRELMLTPDSVRPVTEAITRTLAGGGRVWFVGDLYFQPPGVPPVVLPPPPGAPTGWFETPYSVSWSTQVADFVRRYALRWYRVDVRSGLRVSPTENPSILLVEGWSGGGSPPR